MAIELNDAARIGAPVIRQQRFGEVATLAIVRTEQRDRLRKNLASGEMEPIPNGKDRQGNPKVKQEIVIHCVALPGTSMEAKLGDETASTSCTITRPVMAAAAKPVGTVWLALADAQGAVAEGLQLQGDRQAVRDALTAVSGYQGLTGMLTCNDTGDCATGEALGIFEVTQAEVDGNWPPAVVWQP